MSRRCGPRLRQERPGRSGAGADGRPSESGLGNVWRPEPTTDQGSSTAPPHAGSHGESPTRPQPAVVGPRRLVHRFDLVHVMRLTDIIGSIRTNGPELTDQCIRIGLVRISRRLLLIGGVLAAPPDVRSCGVRSLDGVVTRCALARVGYGRTPDVRHDEIATAITKTTSETTSFTRQPSACGRGRCGCARPRTA